MTTAKLDDHHHNAELLSSVETALQTHFLKVGRALADSGDVQAMEQSVDWHRKLGYVVIVVSGLPQAELEQRYGHLGVALYSLKGLVDYDPAKGHGHQQFAWQTAIGMCLGGAAWLFINHDVAVAISGSHELHMQRNVAEIETVITSPETAALTMSSAGGTGLVIGCKVFQTLQNLLPEKRHSLLAVEGRHFEGRSWTAKSLLDKALEVCEISQIAYPATLPAEPAKPINNKKTWFSNSAHVIREFAKFRGKVILPEEPGTLEEFRGPSVSRALNPVRS